MPRAFRVLAIMAVSAWAPTPGTALQQDPETSFVVIGHMRGEANGELTHVAEELVARLKDLEPDLIFLTGDIILGDQQSALADSATIERDWDLVDATLGRVGVPIHRVPGNHDIHDGVTRDIYYRRYGRPPLAVDFRGNRFLLLATPSIPADNAPLPPGRPGTALRDSLEDAARQLSFLDEELGRTPLPRHVFVMMHHVLWWEEDAHWWRVVHPRLVGRNVRYVFSGDRGPIGTVSHTERDGIRYVQTALAPLLGIERLARRERSGGQYAPVSTFLHVAVKGAEVTATLHAVGVLSSPDFTPETRHAVTALQSANDAAVPPDVRTGFGLSPRRSLALLLVVAMSMAAGAAVLAMLQRRVRRR